MRPWGITLIYCMWGTGTRPKAWFDNLSRSCIFWSEQGFRERGSRPWFKQLPSVIGAIMEKKAWMQFWLDGNRNCSRHVESCQNCISRYSLVSTKRPSTHVSPIYRRTWLVRSLGVGIKSCTLERVFVIPIQISWRRQTPIELGTYLSFAFFSSGLSPRLEVVLIVIPNSNSIKAMLQVPQEK